MLARSCFLLAFSALFARAALEERIFSKPIPCETDEYPSKDGACLPICEMDSYPMWSHARSRYICKPSRLSRRGPLGRRQKLDSSLCPLDTTACPLSGDFAGYECVSTDDELENCGSCGHSCLNLAGVQGVACSGGQCIVASCQEGWQYVDTINGSCRPSMFSSSRRYVKRPTSASKGYWRER